MRIQDFFFGGGGGGGGGGGSGPMVRKQSGCVFWVFFSVLNLFYSLQRWSNGFITEKTILFQAVRIITGMDKTAREWTGTHRNGSP